MTPRSAPNLPSPSKGVYANYFEVGHTAFEFIIDFGQTYGGKSSACHTRIVTSPIYARALLTTLSQAVNEYAARFGPASAESPDARPSDERGESR